MEEKYFEYGDRDIDYLSGKDERMANVIKQVGKLRRTVIPDLFTALVHSIVGQQISTKAHESIWGKICGALGEITPSKILSMEKDELRGFGISCRKADYIKSAAAKIVSGEFNISRLHELSDDRVISELTSLDGIGKWSAEMLMLFSMQRPNILSFGDLGIQRGLRMIYHHRKITTKLYEKYHRLFSPCSSVASLYIWAIASGKYDGFKDYAPQKKAHGKW